MAAANAYARALRAEAQAADLVHRVVRPDPEYPLRFEPRHLTTATTGCHGCHRTARELNATGHGRGCYFDQAVVR